MKIVFFGSDDFALAHLESLINSEHEVTACVTQPDRPKGRGMKIVVSPIKECAQKYNIPVVQPADLLEPSLIDQLRGFRVDLFIVIAYGRFLPVEVIAIPPMGAINVHASLLPRYRGAAPINWAIINGETKTGISVIKINERMDAGDVLAQTETDIDSDETAVTLRTKMISQGPSFLLKVLADIKDCGATKQDESLATFAPKLSKPLGLIDWGKTAQEIDRLVRGLLPWPTAYTFYKGKTLKILEAKVVEQTDPGAAPGNVVRVDKNGFTVKMTDKSLLISKVHFQDAKPMDAHSFAIGHELEVGAQFTNQ